MAAALRLLPFRTAAGARHAVMRSRCDISCLIWNGLVDTGLKQPCSMCIARHTADDCHYTSSGPSQRRLIPPLAEITPQREWRDGRPPSAAGPRSSRSCGTPSRIVEEIERLSTSRHRWKEQLNVLPLDEAVSGELEGGEITVDGKENWERVRLLIPSKASTEVLLEHLVQEVRFFAAPFLTPSVCRRWREVPLISGQCDWLVPAGHAPTIWNASLRRGACRAPVAGLMCMHLALSSLLLGSPGNRLYSPQIDWQHLHHQLYNEAQVFVSPDDTSLENLELLVLLSYYQAYSGSSANTSQDWAGMGVVIAREGGWLDESASVWDHLTAEERQARRRILAELVDLNRSVQRIDPKRSSASFDADHPLPDGSSCSFSQTHWMTFG